MEKIKKYLTHITPLLYVLKLILIISVLLLFLQIGISFFKDKSPIPIDKLSYSINPFSYLVRRDDVSVQPEKRLTDLEYHSIGVDISNIVITKSPREALLHLSMQMEKNPKILKECHGFVHEIGRKSFYKYNDIATALNYQDDICGSGYIHGVIEEYLVNTKDVFISMKTLCFQYDLQEQAGKCYHGIGHGLMYFTENDLPKAVNLCKSYPNFEAQVRCSEGVYMENFGSLRDIHPSKYLDEKNTMYPCSEQPEDFKQGCYYYSPLFYLNLHDEDYKGAMDVCMNAEKGYEDTCIKGVGSRLIKEHIEEIQFVEDVCRKAPKNKFKLCLDGVVSYHLVNYDSESITMEMCFKLDQENQKYCLRSIEAQRGLATN